MDSLNLILILFYAAGLLALAFFGLHKYFLLYLFFKHRRRQAPPPPEPAVWPRVTVQLPIYNEKYVVERLIEAVCRLDYPRDRLEIQVLDDSTDETLEVAAVAVARARAQGWQIEHLRRNDRTGYKAGALQFGLLRARGDLLAVFDADFVPAPDFLRAIVPQFHDPEIGMVQARWGHINRDYSLLTRVQAIFLDGHFLIEHTARSRSGRFFNFNGTAGVWRREAIFSAGGWQYDTITEDLDLSYRAQLAGWRFVFLPDVVAPGELPVEISAYKTQQHRWAKGSVETARKLLPGILRSDLPWKVRLEAAVHLCSNFSYLLMAIPAMLLLPALQVQFALGWKWMLYGYIAMFFSSSLSVMIYYDVAERHAVGRRRGRWRYLPFLMALGIGMSLNNAKAVVEALFKRRGEFKRTPKYRIEHRRDDWRTRSYRSSSTLLPFLEIGMGLYFTAGLVYFLLRGAYFSLPFFVLFQFGFFYMGIGSLVQARQPLHPKETR